MNTDYSKYDNAPQRSGMGRREDRPSTGARIHEIKQKISGNQNNASAKFSISNAKRDDFLQKQQEISEQFDKLWNAYRASFSLEDEKKLQDFAQKYQIKLSLKHEVTKDERSEIARMAFNGTVERPQCKTYQSNKNNTGNSFSPKPREYSEEYSKIVTNPLEYAKNPRAKEDYNLDDNGLWHVMKQFPEFEGIKDRITSGLAQAGVPPEILPQMNLNDFKHFLTTHCSVGQSSSFAKIFPQTDEKGNIVRDFRTQKALTTSAKQRNTIRFINEHPEFADLMMRVPGARKDYVDELVRQMKKGNTDMTCFLKNHPEWKDQTAINVHHIINVKDCRTLEEKGLPLSYINDYDNMCIMGCGTLGEVMQKSCSKNQKHTKLPGIHGEMHNHDTTFRDSKLYRAKWGEYTKPKENDVIARMEPAPGVCCMLAFGDEYCIVDENRKQRQTELQKAQKQQSSFVPHPNAPAKTME